MEPPFDAVGTADYVVDADIKEDAVRDGNAVGSVAVDEREGNGGIDTDGEKEDDGDHVSEPDGLQDSIVETVVDIEASEVLEYEGEPELVRDATKLGVDAYVGIDGNGVKERDPV